MLSEYSPYLLTAASFFCAIYFHWRTPKQLLRPSISSALFSSGLSLILVLLGLEKLVPEAHDAGLMSMWQLGLIGLISGFVYGLLIALLIGYLIKRAPYFFD